MASIITDRGLQVIGATASGTGEANTDRPIDSMSVDDQGTGFSSGDTSLDDAGTVSNHAVNNFDSAPSRSGQTISHEATFGDGEANFEITRIALHNDTEGNVSEATDTLVGGVDGQSLNKTSDFSMTFTLDIQYTDNS